MVTEDMVYVGIQSCGCVVAATIDNPNRKKEVRRAVMDFMKWGTVER